MHSLTLTDAVNLYNSELSDLFNKHCPVKLKQYRKIHDKSRWFNSSLHQLKRTKRKLERRFKKHPSIINKEALKVLKNRYNYELKRTRNEYNLGKINNCYGDSKKFYQTVNTLTGRRKDRAIPSCKDKRQTAENMANFFTSKINDIRKNIVSNDYVFNYSEHDDRSIPVLSEFYPVELNYLTKLVFNMKNKNCKLDPIPTFIVKKYFSLLSHSILYIVNEAIKTQQFPDVLKHSIVTPIIKNINNDFENYKNYRPISNNSFLSKVLEKVLCNQLAEYLENNKLHADCQSAYRKHHSCETSMMKLISDIQQSNIDKNHVSLVSLDCSSAFDTIDQDLLLSKLEGSFYIKEKAINLIKDYFTNRTFSIDVDNKFSSPQPLVYGVPQGSLLGPIFYIAYTKEIEKIVKYHGMKLQMYADDTQIYYPFTDQQLINAEHKINECLKEIKCWMDKNYLKINPNKTIVKLFSTNMQSMALINSFKLLFDSNFLSPSASISVLGISLDSKTSLSSFVDKTARKCNLILRNLRNIKDSLSFNVRVTLISCLVLANLDYCNVLLACSTNTLLLPLKNVLHRSVRFIYNLRKFDHISPFLFKLHFLPIKFRIKFKLSLIAYKIINKMSPVYLQNDFYLFQATTTMNLRPGSGRDNLMFHLSNEQAKKNTIQTKLIVEWNRLPINIRQITSIPSFKTELKTFYFKEAFAQFL